MRLLPPLLSERPPALRFGLTFVTPALGGFGAGLEHEDRIGAARRGALGGLTFGLCLVLADALVVGHRVATIADPPILQALVTTTIGTLLGLAGATLRARIVRRATAVAPA